MRAYSHTGLSSTPKPRNLLCSANTEHGALWRHNFWLIAYLFFALLAKLHNQELVLFLANSVNRRTLRYCCLWTFLFHLLLEYTWLGFIARISYGGGRWQRWQWWQVATAGGSGRHSTGKGKGSDSRSGCQVLWDKMKSEVFDYFEVFLAGSTEDTDKNR